MDYNIYITLIWIMYNQSIAVFLYFLLICNILFFKHITYKTKELG